MHHFLENILVSEELIRYYLGYKVDYDCLSYISLDPYKMYANSTNNDCIYEEVHDLYFKMASENIILSD